MKKITFFTLICLTTILFIGSYNPGFTQEEQPQKKNPNTPVIPKVGNVEIPVMAFRVTKVSNQRETVPIMGSITPFEKTDLRFEERGIVKKVYFEEGDEVNKGDLLAELDERDFILKNDYAKHKYESENSLSLSMEKEYQIKKSLYEKGAILKEKLEELELRIESQKFRAESAKKEWELAEQSMQKIKMYSPCKGKIDKREIEEAELVSPEIGAFSILRIDKVFAEAGITEKDITKIQKKQEAEIKVEAYPEDVFNGNVRNVLASLKGSSRTLTLKIEINNADYDYKLLPGMFIRGDILIRELKDAYLIPNESLIALNPEVSTTFVVQTPNEITDKQLEEGGAKGTIVLKKVTVLSKGEKYSSIDGLPENTLVISHSEGNLVPFATAKIINIEKYEE